MMTPHGAACIALRGADKASTCSGLPITIWTHCIRKLSLLRPYRPVRFVKFRKNHFNADPINLNTFYRVMLLILLELDNGNYYVNT